MSILNSISAIAKRIAIAFGFAIFTVFCGAILAIAIIGITGNSYVALDIAVTTPLLAAYPFGFLLIAPSFTKDIKLMYKKTMQSIVLSFAVLGIILVIANTLDLIEQFVDPLTRGVWLLSAIGFYVALTYIEKKSEVK
jgi:hypothetical protein